MAGFGDLVGVLMQGGLGSSGAQRVENALGEGGLGQAGGILGQMLGGSSGGGGLLGNVLGAAGGMLGNAGRAAQSNPMAAGGLGALAGALFGGGSGAVKGAVGGGAMAMLAGLAFQALSNRSGGSTTAQAPLGIRAPASPEEEQELESTADLMFKAMISAAKADGQIDSAEMDKILGKLQEADTDPELQRLVMEEMHKPLDLDGLIAAIPNEQLAAEAYAASLFAIKVDTPQERSYLQRLARGSGLDDAVVSQLHQALGVS